MHIKPWCATTIARGCVLFRRPAPVRSLGIESLEDEAAVIAEQFMHPDHSQEKYGIVVIALNPFTLASWTLHTVHSSRSATCSSEVPPVLRYNVGMKDFSHNLAPANYVDPVVEAYKKDVDMTLIRENLRLTVDQRFQQLMKLQEFAEELRRAGRKARSQK